MFGWEPLMRACGAMKKTNYKCASLLTGWQIDGDREMWAKEVVSSCQRDPFCSLCIQSNRVPSHDSLFVSPSRLQTTAHSSHSYWEQTYLTTLIAIRIMLIAAIDLCVLVRWKRWWRDECWKNLNEHRACDICIISMCVMREENESKPQQSRVNSFHFGSFSSRGRLERNLCVDEYVEYAEWAWNGSLFARAA